MRPRQANRLNDAAQSGPSRDLLRSRHDPGEARVVEESDWVVRDRRLARGGSYTSRTIRGLKLTVRADNTGGVGWPSQLFAFLVGVAVDAGETRGRLTAGTPTKTGLAGRDEADAVDSR